MAFLNVYIRPHEENGVMDFGRSPALTGLEQGAAAAQESELTVAERRGRNGTPIDGHACVVRVCCEGEP